jgi:YARHG domain
MKNQLQAIFYFFILIAVMDHRFTFAQSDHLQKLTNHYLQDGEIVSWLEFKEEKLAHLSTVELQLLLNHIFARKGYIFRDKQLASYFQQFPWYRPLLANVEHLLTETDKNNIELIKCFGKAKTMRLGPTTGLDSRAWLRGCWQAGTATVAAGYNDRFSFDPSDGSFAFLSNQMQNDAQKKKLDFSGRFAILASNKIEFEIITKDMLVKFPGPSYKDPTSGKTTYRTGLKIQTRHLTKDEGYEYQTYELGDLTHYTNPDGLERYFMKIGGDIYWRISLDICD